jgi:hypothetical protein
MKLDPNTERLTQRHRENGILIDSNLLLLLAVGDYNSKRIETFKRTARYTNSDYQRLRWYLQKFTVLWTTPNILTEVDNLGRQLPSTEISHFSEAMKTLVTKLAEVNTPSTTVVAYRTFSILGLADSTSLLAQKNCLLLSDDLPLCIWALKAGIDAINFNHIRMNS